MYNSYSSLKGTKIIINKLLDYKTFNLVWMWSLGRRENVYLKMRIDSVKEKKNWENGKGFIYDEREFLKILQQKANLNL